MKQRSRKILSVLLALTMLCSLCVPTASAAESRYRDTQGHWAEAAIERWSGYGVVQGYGDTFAPNASITRAQMATILANALGLTEMAENAFTDVAQDDWFAAAVLRCCAAGILLGDNGKASPNRQITRQEAMVMLGRALCIPPEEEPDLTAFPDAAAVGDWAAPLLSAMVKAGMVGGMEDGRLAPAGTMTRAALLTVLDRAVVQYIQEPGTYEMTKQDGIILVAAGDVTLTGKTDADILVTPAADGKTLTFQKAEVTGSITVQADDAKVTSKDSKLPEITATGTGTTVESSKPASSGSSGGGGSSGSVSRDLTVSQAGTVSGGTYQNVTIASSVGDGTVELNGVTISGTLTVNGGGSDTVHLNGCTLRGNVVLDKADGEAPRLLLTNTPVSAVEVRKPALLEADAASAITAVEAKANVEVKGEETVVTAITVPADTQTAVAITVNAGSVDRVEARSATTVTGAADSVANVVAQAPVTVASDTVEKVEIPESAADGVSVAVTGTGEVEVEVNSSGGAAITTDEEASVAVSTTLETAPEVTVNGGVIAHIHKWDAGTVTTAATCQQEGVKTYTCTADGCTDPAAAKTESIPKLPHTLVEDMAVAATCTTAGKTAGKHCSVCGTVIVAQTEVPALGHAFTGAYHFDTEGHWHVCSRCGAAEEKRVHTWDSGVTEGQTTTYTCTVCGATRRESVPTEETVEITFAQTQKEIKASWTGGSADRYAYCFQNQADGSKTLYFWTQEGQTESYGLSHQLPRPQTGTASYDFVLYEVTPDNRLGNEVGRVEDAVQVTVSGQGVAYNMEFAADTYVNGDYVAQINRVTLSGALPTGIWALQEWSRSGKTYSVGGSSISQTMEEIEQIQVGDVFDLRILTEFALREQVIQATMTPPSTKTYTASDTPEATITMHEWKRDVLLNATGADAFKLADDTGIVSLYGTTTMSELAASYGTEASGLDLVAFSGTDELIRLEDAVTIDRNNYAVPFTVAADQGSTQITITTPYEDDYYVYVIRHQNGTYAASGRIVYTGTTLDPGFSGSAAYTLQEGDTVDVRRVSCSCTDQNQVWASISAPSTYTHSTATAQLQPTIYAQNGILRLDWPRKDGYSGNYYVNGTNVGNTWFYHLVNTVRAATEDGSYSYTVSTSNEDGTSLEPWATGEGILTVRFDSSITPNVTIQGQSDGSYLFTPQDGFTGAYEYQLYSPDNELIHAYYVGAGKTASVAPYEGCYFKVRQLGWPLGNTLPEVTVTVSDWVEIDEFTPYNFTATNATVTDEESFRNAVNAGGTVTLADDITITNTRITQGGPVTVDLKGYTLDLGSQNSLSVTNGKTITFRDSSPQKTGEILGEIMADGKSSLTLDGITLSQSGSVVPLVVNGARALAIQNSTVGNVNIQEVGSVTVSGTTFTSGVDVFASTAVFTGCSLADENQRFALWNGAQVTFYGFTVADPTVNKIQVSESQLTIGAGTYNFDPQTITGATIAGTVTAGENGTWTVTNGSEG